jgi:hypothetical protein
VSARDFGGAVLRGGPAVVVPARRDARIPGLDVARGLAILGMLAAHTLPGDGGAFYDGRSSILFATLAGISLGLMTGGEHPAPRTATTRARARVSIVIRALLLIALGLGLWLLGTNIAIILDSYGFLFLVCVPLLFLNRWLLGALAVVFAVVGPIVVQAITDLTSATGAAPVSPDSPLAIPLSWLDSYYPAPVWLAYVLAGLAISRFGVTRPRVQLVMIVGGVVVAALGYGLSAALGAPVEAHSDSTAEAISSGAFVLAVIGLLVAGIDPAETSGHRRAPAGLGRIDAIDHLHRPGARHRSRRRRSSPPARRCILVDALRLSGARVTHVRARLEGGLLAGAPGVAVRPPDPAQAVARDPW